MSLHSFFLFISLAFPELQIQNMSNAFETLSRIGLELLEDPNCGASALKNFLQKEHKTKGTVLKVGFLLSVHIDNAKSWWKLEHSQILVTVKGQGCIIPLPRLCLSGSLKAKKKQPKRWLIDWLIDLDILDFIFFIIICTQNVDWLIDYAWVCYKFIFFVKAKKKPLWVDWLIDWFSQTVFDILDICTYAWVCYKFIFLGKSTSLGAQKERKRGRGKKKRERGDSSDFLVLFWSQHHFRIQSMAGTVPSAGRCSPPYTTGTSICSGI